MKNNSTLMILLSTLSILISASTLTSIYAQENMTDTDMPKFFAIQHAQSASISKVNATTNFLELHDVSDVILFSDRPDRIVKTESTQQFLDRWYDAGTDTKNSFFSDPPNAALVIDDQEGQDVAILELFEPAYDYDSNILVYNFNYLNNTNTILPNEFGETTLVIDSSHPMHIHL
ncbi:MAG: hypothetical protein MRJ93_10190 [Nitrososphaeraceae archaeon]|nr:hypothetical protein [Nitrososphaeraceae archaeon]